MVGGVDPGHRDGHDLSRSCSMWSMDRNTNYKKKPRSSLPPRTYRPLAVFDATTAKEPRRKWPHHYFEHGRAKVNGEGGSRLLVAQSVPNTVLVTTKLDLWTRIAGVNVRRSG